MIRGASAVWKGTIREGSGTTSTDSGVLNGVPYSFKMRFGDEPGTNPEELVAAAHASCFSMKLSAELGERGITDATIETECSITLEPPIITKSHLDVKVTASGADPANVDAAAAAAKAECPISKLLNAEITLSLAVAI